MPADGVPHARPALGQDDVVRAGLQLGCDDRRDALPQDHRRLAHGSGGHRPAAAAGGAGAEARDRGVALDDGDVVDQDAEGVGGELDDGGLDAVAGRPPATWTLTVPEGSTRMVAASVA